MSGAVSAPKKGLIITIDGPSGAGKALCADNWRPGLAMSPPSTPAPCTARGRGRRPTAAASTARTSALLEKLCAAIPHRFPAGGGPGTGCSSTARMFPRRSARPR
jgi:hypothetical protein